jgi:hypothetical protein
MIPTRSPRTLTAIWLALALALAAMAGPGTILAAPKPSGMVSVSAPASPPTVTHGRHVVFDATFTNSPNPSNFAQFFLTAQTPGDGGPGEAALVDAVPSQGTCDTTTGDLSCTLGAVNSGATVIVSVIYLTPTSGSSLAVDFEFTSTGDTGSDTPGRSHGDAYPVTGTVDLRTSDDFSGGYLHTGESKFVSDLQTFSRRNPQWTAVNAPELGIGVSVGELIGAGPPCPGESAASCFGQWSAIYVAGGDVYPNGFAVQIGYDANKPAANFVHLFDAGVTDPITGLPYELITNTCSSENPAAAELPCKIVTTSMGDTFATLFVKLNGNIKGY